MIRLLLIPLTFLIAGLNVHKAILYPIFYVAWHLGLL